MTAISDNLQAVRERIMRACTAAGRPPDSVMLLAVSKTWPVADIASAAAAGQGHFGESYLQEALPKLDALPALDWHFIGPLQSNKTRPVAERFAWVHSVDRLKIGQRLSEQRPPELPPLNICLQVNVSGEASKSGCTPVELPPLAAAIAALPGLCLRGLMAIPEPCTDTLRQHLPFARLRALRDELNNTLGLTLDTLSMGMSDDLEAAIDEGSTLVRVGTAIFGAREYH